MSAADAESERAGLRDAQRLLDQVARGGDPAALIEVQVERIANLHDGDRLLAFCRGVERGLAA